MALELNLARDRFPIRGSLYSHALTDIEQSNSLLLRAVGSTMCPSLSSSLCRYHDTYSKTQHLLVEGRQIQVSECVVLASNPESLSRSRQFPNKARTKLDVSQLPSNRLNSRLNSRSRKSRRNAEGIGIWHFDRTIESSNRG